MPALEATGGARQEDSMDRLVKRVRCFCSDDAGAITIDWVALTSGILMLSILVVYAIFNVGVSPVIDDVNSILITSSDLDVGPAPMLNGGGVVPDP